MPQGPGSLDTKSLAAAPASTRQLGKCTLTNTRAVHPPSVEVEWGQQRTLGNSTKFSPCPISSGQSLWTSGLTHLERKIILTYLLLILSLSFLGASGCPRLLMFLGIGKCVGRSPDAVGRSLESMLSPPCCCFQLYIH